MQQQQQILHPHPFILLGAAIGFGLTRISLKKGELRAHSTMRKRSWSTMPQTIGSSCSVWLIPSICRSTSVRKLSIFCFISSSSKRLAFSSHSKGGSVGCSMGSGGTPYPRRVSRVLPGGVPFSDEVWVEKPELGWVWRR